MGWVQYVRAFLAIARWGVFQVKGPCRGDTLQMEVNHRQGFLQTVKLRSTHPLLHLQCLAEALVEIHLHQVRECSDKGRIALVILPQTRYDPIGLVNEVDYLICPRVNCCIPQE